MSVDPPVFEPGDVVVCINDKDRRDILDKGRRYTVEGAFGGDHVKLHGVRHIHRTSRFELAAPAAPPAPERIVLDPLDPFEAVLIKMVTTNRSKRADYTTRNSSAWENFDIAEERLARRYGLDREKIRGAAVDMMLFTKDTRLDAISSRGEAQNESAEDTLLDEAVYATIRYGRMLYPDGVVK